MTSGGQPVPEQIAAAIEASDHPELSIREVMERAGLSKGQVVLTAGSMDRLELDRSLGVVRLREDDGGEFVDDHEDELLPDGGHCAGGTDREGLYAKYDVQKDGEPVKDCFVLVPEDDPAARRALETYIEVTESEALAQDLRDWIASIEIERYTTGTERSEGGDGR